MTDAKKTEPEKKTPSKNVIDPKDKLTAHSATNNLKKSRQSNRRKTKGTAGSKNSLFNKDDNNRYSGKYNCTDAHAKQKLSGFSRDFKAHGDQTRSNLDSQDSKLNANLNRKLQVGSNQNKIKTKESNKEILEAKIKRDIIAENITKQGKKLHVKPVRKIPATSNFVYEFNPCANVEHLNSLMSETRLRSTNNPEQISSFSRTDTSFDKSTLNRNADFTKRKSSAVLPKLNTRIDPVMGDPDSNITNFNRNTSLPILGKGDPTQTLSKQLDDEFERSDIDREVENVKSAWQALRAERDWTKGKDCIANARTRKLYEILEKMTCKIDKVQRNYMDPKTNNYLHKSATNVLKTACKPSLEEEAEIVRDIIFPKRKAKIKSEITNFENADNEMIIKDIAKMRFDETEENILTNKQATRNLFSSKHIVKKRSIHTDAHEHNVDNDIESVHTIAHNICNKKHDTTINILKPAFKDDSKMKTKIKSSIEKYVQMCTDNIHKTHNIEEKEDHFQDMKPSASDIADILASHNIANIGPHGLYENFEKRDDAYDSEDCTSENDKNYPRSNIATNTMSIDIAQDNRKIHDDTFFESTELCKSDIRPTKVVDVISTGTSGHSNVASCQDNAFIKMGLNILNKDLSRDKVSQILQSEYLRKDLSL